MANTRCIQFVELSNRRQFAKKWIFYDEVIKETRFDISEALAPYLPDNALDEVVAMLKKYAVLLRIETPRKESRGYYRWGHSIGINNNLDKDNFLHVFLHEYAHLLTYLSFPKASVHGAEFYYYFQELVLNFIEKKILHQDMFLPIVNYSGNYNYYKKHFGFKFCLKIIKVGAKAIYMDDIIVRDKGQKGLINCIRESNNAKIQLPPGTEVLPVLDLKW